jgi:hypothetical protein
MIINYKAIVEELEAKFKEASISGQVHAQETLNLFIQIKNKHSIFGDKPPTFEPYS